MHTEEDISAIERIAVLATCHNRKEQTLCCLRALYSQKLSHRVTIVVYLVDDGCTDGTRDSVRNEFPDVRLLEGDGSLYWCGGMRLAWAEAMKARYDAYLWLNDDTILLPSALDTLLATARRVRAREGHDGIIVGSCRDPNTAKHTYGGRVKSSRRSRLPDRPLTPSHDILACDTMNGNLVLVTGSAFSSLGNFSQPYIHAFGDTDYGMRASRMGIPLRVAPGYLALCEANTYVPAWTDPTVPLMSRWRDMRKPRGLPPMHWLSYVRCHTGFMWPFYFIKPFIRLLFPRKWASIVAHRSNSRITVGFFASYYPHYRRGIFNKLANTEDIQLHVHTSSVARPGFSLLDPSDVQFQLLETKIHHIPVPIFAKELAFVPSLIRSVVIGKYDVFVIPLRMTDISAWIGLFAARLIGRHVCVWGHGFLKEESKWSSLLRKWMTNLSRSAIFYSDKERDRAISIGIAPEKLFVAYNALDTDRSNSLSQIISPDDLDRFRRAQGLEGRKVVLFTGRLQSRKKPQVLVSAMEYVIKDEPNALALFIGEGEMRGEIERTIADLKLDNHVRLVGAVFDEQMMAMYFMCSIVAVMPAAAGLAIQHAFGYGVPIITGDNFASHGPELDLVKDGLTGIVCKDSDAIECAHAISGLLLNEDERNRISINCRRVIAEAYNVDTMAHGFVQAFHWACINANRKRL